MLTVGFVYNVATEELLTENPELTLNLTGRIFLGAKC